MLVPQVLQGSDSSSTEAMAESEFNKLDADGSGGIDHEEWVYFWLAALAQADETSFAHHMAEIEDACAIAGDPRKARRVKVLEEVYQRMDLNGSGTISWKEFQIHEQVHASLVGSKFDLQASQQNFNAIKKMNVSEIEKSEWLRYYSEHLQEATDEQFTETVMQFAQTGIRASKSAQFT